MKNELDEKLFALIAGGLNIAWAHEASLKVNFRLLDRARQRLRKSGRIVYSQKDGWKVKK